MDETRLDASDGDEDRATLSNIFSSGQSYHKLCRFIRVPFVYLRQVRQRVSQYACWSTTKFYSD